MVELDTPVLITFLVYFSIGLMGSFTKDLYETLVHADYQIKIKRIFIGAITTGFIFMAIDEYVTLASGQKYLIAFILGICGFEIFGKLNSKEMSEMILSILNKLKK